MGRNSDFFEYRDFNRDVERGFESNGTEELSFNEKKLSLIKDSILNSFSMDSILKIVDFTNKDKGIDITPENIELFKKKFFVIKKWLTVCVFNGSLFDRAFKINQTACTLTINTDEIKATIFFKH